MRDTVNGFWKQKPVEVRQTLLKEARDARHANDPGGKEEHAKAQEEERARKMGLFLKLEAMKKQIDSGREDRNHRSLSPTAGTT